MVDVVSLIRSGNIKLLLCFAFYLAWWIIAFNPKTPIRGLQSAWLLIPALILGILAMFDITQGIVLVGGPIPGMAIVVFGATNYLALFIITSVLLHRPVTTELLIIVLWLTIALLEVDSLVALESIAFGWGVILAILCLAGAAASLVCYQLFYKLDAVAAFVDGAIPLLLAGVMTGAITLCAK